MKKLGIDASRANKPQKTGTEWYAWHLIRELQKIIPPSVEVLLYTCDKLDSKLAPRVSHFREVRLNWPLRKFWTLGRLSLEMKRRSPDLLWVPTHTLPFSAPKSVVTIHDVGFLSRPDLYKTGDLVFHKFSTKRIIYDATHIITVSEFSKREIIKHCGTKEEKISVIPLAPATAHRQYFKDEIQGVLNKHSLSKPYFIFVGRIEKKKNIKGLLQAFSFFRKKNPEAELVLAGKAGYGGERALLAAEARSGLHVIGYAEEGDLPALISGARALILPSFYEGFGLPVLEAFACGTPVIASSVGSLPEIAHGAALLFDPLKAGELFLAMENIYSNPRIREELREKGLLRAQQFSWTKTAAETWRVLEKFI